MGKKGAEFEALVQRIQATLHRRSRVTPNAIIADLETGQPREVDVLIELEDGPTCLRVIGEVRDRGRPEDATWVEQVVQKKMSVGAHAAFLVSSSGFTEPAVRKAEKHLVATYSFEDAADLMWRDAVRLQHIQVPQREVGFAFELFERDSGETVVPNTDCMSALLGGVELPLKRFDPRIRSSRLLQLGVAADRDLSAKLDSEGRFREDGTYTARVELAEGIQVVDDTGKPRAIGSVEVEITQSWREVSQPLVLLLMRSTSGDVVAQVFRGQATIGLAVYEVELVVPGPVGRPLTARDALSGRVTPLSDYAKANWNGMSATLSETGVDDGVIGLALTLQLH